jgi:large subunit ribosomal protein L2
MGKNLIQQRRGRVRGRYSVPSHKYRGNIKYGNDRNTKGIVERLIHDPGRSAPVAQIRMENNKKILMIATEGTSVSNEVKFTGSKADCELGNIMPIGAIPDGYPIYNIEITPGDGGKMVRAGGSGAYVMSHDAKKTIIKLPSGQFKTLDSLCRATVGVAAGGGRQDKPFMKAGKKWHAQRGKGRNYPVVRGVAMNPVDHPHGGGSHQHVGKPSCVSRDAPPGRKVGNIAARRTGRR